MKLIPVALLFFAASLPTTPTSTVDTPLSTPSSIVDNENVEAMERGELSESKCSSICDLDLTNSNARLLCVPLGNGTEITSGTMRNCSETEIEMVNLYRSNVCARANQVSATATPNFGDNRTRTVGTTTSSAQDPVPTSSPFVTTTSFVQGPMPTWNTELGIWSEVESSLRFDIDPGMPITPKSICCSALDCVEDCSFSSCNIFFGVPVAILLIVFVDK